MDIAKRRGEWISSKCLNKHRAKVQYKTLRTSTLGLQSSTLLNYGIAANKPSNKSKKAKEEKDRRK